MFAYRLLLLMALFLFSLSACSNCDPGWTLFKGLCYTINDKSSWTNAEALCKQSNAHLISIHSNGEQAFAASLAKEDYLFWTGGFVNMTQHRLDKYWSDGSSWDYNRFYREDVRAGPTCLVSDVDTYTWENFDCYYEFASICKKRVNANIQI
ncbi:hypothetical protein L596_011895 [Steinernema carpocapsae]|uniref:C-type lectin domain-containing protein n=1 Tax=Steinernema carpocapsae TaxID=34508 RepID=A0A4U5NVM7_STECR|nr:hypothetical protein L596_011895 [Steinernema carpocapsae]